MGNGGEEEIKAIDVLDMSHTERHEPKLDSPGAPHTWLVFFLFDDLAKMLPVCFNRGILISARRRMRT